MKTNLALRLPEAAPFADDERRALDTILGRASGEQRAWLSGFLAGLAANADAAPRAEAAPQAAPPRAAEPLLILYATESGNAETLAGKLASDARRKGFRVTLTDVADTTPADVAKAKNLLVIAATWGEGDPPSRAEPFYKALMAEARRASTACASACWRWATRPT
jgi:sulfite reductase (NADPH) flavoprotein alpha-component